MFLVLFSANNPYASSASPPYPTAQQPSAPPTGGPPPPTAPGIMKLLNIENLFKNFYFFVILDGSSLPYPGAYMQPFFPMPPGYNPYNPFFNTSKLRNLNIIIYSIFISVAPPYPMAGAPQYPQQGNSFDNL